MTLGSGACCHRKKPLAVGGKFINYVPKPPTHRYVKPGANWTFDKSQRPGDGLASKPHLAVGGPGEWNPQQLTESPGHTESKVQLSHPLG